MDTDVINSLKVWFRKKKRPLPWRDKDITSYHIWVSEVMLQQTQVETVIPYFQRFLERFPTLIALSQAPIEEVIKSWEGLGYYKRAHYLHQGAQQIVRDFDGELPNSEAELKTIKGIGSYTCGAILSFAFHKKKAAVDANVFRVLVRYFGELLSYQEVEKRCTQLLPDQEPWVVMEALIELGALVCRKKEPLCSMCPLKSSCRARSQGTIQILPPSRKSTAISLKRSVFLLKDKECMVVKKGGFTQDLWEFPYCESVEEHVEEKVQHLCGVKNIQRIEKLPKERHSFTKYRVELFPYLLEVKISSLKKPYLIKPIVELENLPFSAGHRRILFSYNLRYL